jgi:hypothetical protein
LAWASPTVWRPAHTRQVSSVSTEVGARRHALCVDGGNSPKSARPPGIADAEGLGSPAQPVEWLDLWDGLFETELTDPQPQAPGRIFDGHDF